jgi:hypothetical protein
LVLLKVIGALNPAAGFASRAVIGRTFDVKFMVSISVHYKEEIKFDRTTNMSTN